jgi:hypothetical protein
MVDSFRPLCMGKSRQVFGVFVHEPTADGQCNWSSSNWNLIPPVPLFASAVETGLAG